MPRLDLYNDTEENDDWIKGVNPLATADDRKVHEALKRKNIRVVREDVTDASKTNQSSKED